MLDKVIDLSIWMALTLFVMNYIMPFFGLPHFGPFQFGGIIAACGLFELYGSVTDLVSDFEGDRIINYTMTLPAPSLLILLSKVIAFSIIYLLLTIAMIPVGKICLWHELDMRSIEYGKLTIMLFVQNIFYACFVIWVASIVSSISKLGSVWARFIFPMWFMGGFHFSWLALYTVTPIIAVINLLNPMMYITEGVRATVLGQAEHINFWVCVGVVLICAVICFMRGAHNLKRRLDFV
jgi:hypothetical protein